MKIFLVTMFMFVSMGLMAQQTPSASTITASLDHTHCSLAQTPQTDGKGPGVCIATDGIWVQFSTDTVPRRIDLPAAVVAGVTSLNGKTGDLTISASPSTPNVIVPATTVAVPSVVVSVK